MKKKLALILAMMMVVTSFAACKANEPADTTAADTTASAVDTTKAITENATYKLGLGTVVSTESSKTGTAQVDATFAAVITDADGKIVDCYIDVAQSKMSIENGKATTGQEYLTKQEKKEAYGMTAASSIGKEWYEQANFFAEYVIGKTAAEVAAIAIETNASGHEVATDTDILAGCTMAINEFQEAIAKACVDEKANTFESDTVPEIAFGSETEDSSSKDAADGTDGLAAMYTTYVAIAVVDSNIKVACVDAIQPKIAFNTAGEIGETTFGGSKRELGDDYNMVKFGGAIAEWFEQAAAFEDYIAGMTATEVASIPTEINAESHEVTTDADLLAGCTMAINDFQAVIAKALTK